MLGWLRTAGLTDSVGGQEGVSDGYLMGVPPKPPGVHANNRIWEGRSRGGQL